MGSMMKVHARASGPLGATRHFSHEGGIIAFDDAMGSGLPLVCIPGMGDLRQEYRWLTPLLKAAGHRVATMDLRGHGESSADWSDYSPEAVGRDIVALLRHLGLRRAVLVGTSFAAASAVWAAAHAPELVGGLVLVGPFVRDVPMSTAKTLMLKAMMSIPGRTSIWVSFYRSLHGVTKPADLSEHVRALKINLSDRRRFDALRTMMFSSKKNCADVISRVRVPALVLMGSADPDFTDPRSEAESVAKSLGGECRIIDGAGHYPHAEQPSIVSYEIEKFITKSIA